MKLTARKKNILKWFKPRLGKLYIHTPIELALPEYYYHNPPLRNPPSISIVTPSFNQKNFIGRTIRSVLDQHYPNLEYVVQDGGSTDGSPDVIQQFENQLKRWESKKDKGQGNAINLGFAGTTGEIMAYLNSDDLLLPGVLHYIANYFIEHPEVDAVYGHRILIDTHDKEVGRWVMPPHADAVLHWADFIPQETLFWRRSLWEKAGGQIDENFQFALDWDLLLRFQKAGAKIVRLPRFLGAFRIHEAQKTSADMGSLGVAEIQRLQRRNIGYTPFSNEIKSKLIPYIMKHYWCQLMYKLGLVKY